MRTLLITLSVLLLVGPASAIIRRHDREDSKYRELAKQYVAVADLNLPGGAGTLISPRWILTAAHAAAIMKKSGHQVKIGSNLHDVVRVVTYPGGGEGKDDLALVELARPVKGIAPIPVYEGRNEATGDRLVTFVGRGFAGDGQTGPVLKDRELRAATNRIEDVKQNWLVFLFDAPPAGTKLEGISGPGDSGGPALMVIDGQTVLAGVSSGQDSRAAGKEGVYGVTEYYVRVSSYAEWIRTTMRDEKR